jgi:hypothetical protein
MLRWKKLCENIEKKSFHFNDVLVRKQNVNQAPTKRKKKQSQNLSKEIQFSSRSQRQTKVHIHCDSEMEKNEQQQINIYFFLRCLTIRCKYKRAGETLPGFKLVGGGRERE